MNILKVIPIVLIISTHANADELKANVKDLYKKMGVAAITSAEKNPFVKKYSYEYLMLVSASCEYPVFNMNDGMLIYTENKLDKDCVGKNITEVKDSCQIIIDMAELDICKMANSLE